MAAGSKTATYWNAQSVSYLPRTLTPLPFWTNVVFSGTPSLSTWFVDATLHLLKVFPYWLHMVCKKYFISGATSVKFLFYKEALGDRLNKVEFS